MALLFLSVANAFNPLAYRSITQKSLRQSANRLFFLLMVITLATALLMLPSLYSKKDVGKLSRLSVQFDIATKSPIDARLFLLGNAKVLVNTTADARTASKYDIVLTGRELLTRPLLCYFREDVCNLLGIRQHSTSMKGIDLSRDAGRTITGIFLLLLPGLLMLLYALMAVKYFAIILAISALSYAIMKLTRKNTGIIDTLKIASYSGVVLVVLDFTAFIMRNGPIAIHPAVPILAYLAMLITGLIINEQMNDDGI